MIIVSCPIARALRACLCRLSFALLVSVGVDSSQRRRRHQNPLDKFSCLSRVSLFEPAAAAAAALAPSLSRGRVSAQLRPKATGELDLRLALRRRRRQPPTFVRRRRRRRRRVNIAPALCGCERRTYSTSATRAARESSQRFEPPDAADSNHCRSSGQRSIDAPHRSGGETLRALPVALESTVGVFAHRRCC